MDRCSLIKKVNCVSALCLALHGGEYYCISSPNSSASHF